MYRDYIHEYYDSITSGKVIAGRWIKLAYKMIVEGLENKSFFLDLKKADDSIRFVETFCHHTKGALGRELVVMELWQKALFSAMFGITDELGVRQFREVVLICGRKCGKTQLASWIAEYCAYIDDENGYGNEIYFLAPKFDQTDLVWSAFWSSVSFEPDLLEMSKKRKSDIYIADSNTTVKKIAFSSKKSDGFNPSLTICDEMAAWEGEAGLRQYEVMTSGTGARRAPLTVSISTANYISDGIYDELVARSTRVLLGGSEEKRLLPILYMIDDPDKWDDMEELHKSLPNLGVSVSTDFMEEQIAIAKGSLSKKKEFLTKYCNIKQNAITAWLPTEVIEKCSGPHLSEEMFRSSYALLGIDLSQTTDLTAAVCLIEQNGVINVLARFYLPADKLEEATARDQMPYQAYIDRGILFLSGESYIDYHDVFKWFTELVEQYEILPLMAGYDKWQSQYLIQDMKQYGFQCDDVRQWFNLSPVLKEMEGLMRDGKINIGDNDLLKAHLMNAGVKMDPETDKIRLVKIKSNAHIDGAAALSDALCVRQKYYEQYGEQLKNEEE